MIRYFLIALAFILANHANAATTTGADWWKKCPGSACPARESTDSVKAKADPEPVNREKVDKERNGHEKTIKSHEKDERRRDIDR